MEVFVLMIGMIVGSIGVAVVMRRRRVPGALVAAAAIDLYCGVVVASLGTMHLLAVVGRALAGKGSGPGGTFVYDFRFYSLLLFGVTLIAPALAAWGRSSSALDGAMRRRSSARTRARERASSC
jgi:hypothetical protein